MCKGLLKVRWSKSVLLPAYWPELAPIDLYLSRMKTSLVKKIGDKQLDMISDDTMPEISECLNSLSKEYIQRSG